MFGALYMYISACTFNTLQKIWLEVRRQYFDCTILKGDSQKYGSTYILPRPLNLNLMEPKAYLKSHHFSYNNFWRYFLRPLKYRNSNVASDWLWFCCAIQRKERKLSKRLELCVEIYAKNEKRQFFSKSDKNIHGLNTWYMTN